MQTERADSMHKLRADKGISGHLFSGIVEQDRTQNGVNTFGVNTSQ